jgi:hypothetical protein
MAVDDIRTAVQRHIWRPGLAKMPKLTALANDLQDLSLSLRRNRPVQGIVL